MDVIKGKGCESHSLRRTSYLAARRLHNFLRIDFTPNCPIAAGFYEVGHALDLGLYKTSAATRFESAPPFPGDRNEKADFNHDELCSSNRSAGTFAITGIRKKNHPDKV